MLSHLQPKFKKILVAILVLAALGLVDALYLSVEHYRGEVPPCTLTGGCEKVTTSEYSVLFGVPGAYLGALYYISLLSVLFLFVDLKKKNLFHLATGIVSMGFLFSLYFTYLQFFVIEALCPYCLFSALVSSILVVLLWFCNLKKLFH